MKKAEDKTGGKSALGLCRDLLRVIIFAWAACGVCNLWFDIDLNSIIGALGITGMAINLRPIR